MAGEKRVGEAVKAKKKKMVRTCIQYTVYLGMVSWASAAVLVVFFALTDRASTIPSNVIRGCQSVT